MYEVIGNWNRNYKLCDIKSISEKTNLCIMGWVNDISFNNDKIKLELRDGTGIEYFVILKDNIREPIYKKLQDMTIESVIGLKGVLNPEKINKLDIDEVKIFNRAHEPFPVNDLDIGDTGLLPRRGLVIRNPRIRTILKVNAEIRKSTRNFLENQGFVEFSSNVLGIATDPGVRTANLFTLPSYSKTPYVLSSSAQLYKQAALSALDRAFTIFPALRAEPKDSIVTGRHLSEFTELDVEMAFATREDILSLGEHLLCFVLESVKESCKKELDNLNVEIHIPKIPFTKITHEEAVKMATQEGIKTDIENEISWEAEVFISKRFNEPFWIVDYPVKSRAWYYRQDIGNPCIAKTFDLIYPNGYGEGITGGEREYDYDTLMRRMEERGDEPKKYLWYTEMFKYGMPPSVGFGLGIERLVRYISKSKYIWETTLFPKVPNILSP